VSTREVGPSAGTEVDASAPPADPLQGRLPSHFESALIEYSKQLVAKSIETSLDFHKTMLGVSATFGSAITTLVPVLIWGDKDAKWPSGPGWLIVVPALLMLLSAVCFALGYYPQHSQLKLNDLDAVRSSRETLLRRRAFLATIGLGLFCGSVLLLVGLVLFLRQK
jgi:hypothetical protein